MSPFVPHRHHTARSKGATQRGFTVIELIVTLSIVIFATGLVMIRYASFNSSVLLNSLAYQVAFDLRETQSLAISVRGTDTASFYEEYGMYFDISTKNQYILFQDANNERAEGIRYDSYGGGENDEKIGDPILIDPRFTIEDLCVVRLGSSPDQLECSADGVTNISIAFARPNFDAVMYNTDIGVLREARIILGTGDGSSVTRTVVVTRNGQITVK